MNKVQLGTRVGWIGFAIRLDNGSVAPEAVKVETARNAIATTLGPHRVNLSGIASLRGLLAWVANLYEACRPFLQSLLVLGQADPAR